ncbi:hypothetical protein AUQ54_01730 [Listeria monocytogenes]|nr:hypothetical protein [Listeria monocytogenes]
MSSELVKKLEDREQTLRENSLVYRLDEEQEKLLEKCKKEFRCLRLIYTSDKACEDLISMYPLSLRAMHAFTTWAIEQEKKEEE